MESERPAGFWIRAVAALLDFALFFLVQISFGYVAARIVGPSVEDSAVFLPLVWIFTLIFSAVYTSVLHALVGGQTLGKSVVGIRVVTTDGRPVPLGAALLRYAAYFASLVPFALGYAIAGLRHDKRALHDLLAGTRVERARPGGATVSDPVPSSEAA